MNLYIEIQNYSDETQLSSSSSYIYKENNTHTGVHRTSDGITLNRKEGHL